jgi:hypothetical protein
MTKQTKHKWNVETKSRDTKNLLSKARDKSNPWAVFRGQSHFGQTTVKLLKTYQKPVKEILNEHARWQVAVKSDYTFGGYDIGDSYLRDVVRGLRLTHATDEFKENYWHVWQDFYNLTGFDYPAIETKG